MSFPVLYSKRKSVSFDSEFDYQLMLGQSIILARLVIDQRGCWKYSHFNEHK